MKNLFVLLLLLIQPLSSAFGAQNSDIKGFIQLKNGQELYVEYQAPKANQPILVILNGLTYNLHSWDMMFSNMKDQGYGILRYDPRGQGRTLLKYAPIKETIHIDTQVEDLDQLLDKLAVRGRVSLLGLSYGGGLALAYSALHPERVEKMILMAPYVAALESQDKMIRKQIEYARMMNPLVSKYTDDELYETLFRTIVYTTYPSAEPVILENPYKLEATFRLANGIRKFNSLDVVKQLPSRSVHLIIAQYDQYVPRKTHDEFWDALPSSVRESKLVVNWSEHKIPEAFPTFAAAWVNEIMTGNRNISQGRHFEGKPGEMTATSGRIQVKMSRK